MSSSTDAAPRLATPQLRTGSWTRLGDGAVLGDAVTEQALGALAESTRDAARAQGYAVGWAEGRRAAEALARSEAAAVAARVEAAELVRAEEHAAAVAALEVAAAGVRAVADQARASVEDQALALATSLTETIVGCTLAATEDTGALAVRRALAAVGTEPLVQVHLHPDDARSVEASGLQERGVRVTPDTELTRGDALVELLDHVLDLRITTALERVRTALAEESLP